TRGRAVQVGAIFVLLQASASIRGATTIDNVPMSLRPVRVLVADGIGSASIRSSGELTIRSSGDSESAKSSVVGNAISVRVADASLMVDDQAWPQDDIYIESKGGGIVLVTDTGQDNPIEMTFAGRLRVLSEGGLQIINEVDLDDYVSS